MNATKIYELMTNSQIIFLHLESKYTCIYVYHIKYKFCLFDILLIVGILK